MKKIKRRQSGYLLLTVMVTIVIAGLFLTSLAQRSILLATEAQYRQQELQLRWGTVSSQRALLPAATSIFNTLQQAAEDRFAAQSRRSGNQNWSPPPASVRLSLILGGLNFGFILADEDAKANLNTIYHYRGEARVERYLAESSSGLIHLPAQLLPEISSLNLAQSEPDEEADEGRPAAFRSWGEVVDLRRVDTANTASALIATLALNTTCWGSGHLNVVRASDETIRHIGTLIVSRSKIEELVREHREHPDHHLEQLIEQLALDPIDRYHVEDLLTEQSSCYSLWITADSGKRLWRRLAISEQFEEGQTQTQTFVF